MLVALGVDLIHLGAASIAFDEATSLFYVQLNRAAFVDVVLRRDPNQSLYYVFLRLWVGIFGEGEVAVRSLSVLFGVPAIGAMYLLGRHLFDRMTGLVAGSLPTFDTFMVRYAQTARCYSLLVLLVILSTLFFVRELDRPSRRNRIMFVTTSVLAVYTHYFAALILVVQLGALMLSRWRVAHWRPWLNALTTVAIGCLPAVVLAYRTGTRPIMWVQPSVPADILTVLTDLASGSGLLLCLLLSAGCAGAARAWRQSRAWSYNFVVAWLFLPIALCFLLSLVQPLFVGRYLIICLPAFVLFGAAGLVDLRPRAVASAVVACVMGLNAWQLTGFYARQEPENWRAATSYVLDSMQSRDGIVYFTDSAQKPLGYYARRRGVALPSLEQAGPGLAERKRVWFVIRTPDIALQPDVFARRQSALRERLQLTDRRDFDSLVVELYVR